MEIQKCILQVCSKVLSINLFQNDAASSVKNIAMHFCICFFDSGVIETVCKLSANCKI